MNGRLIVHDCEMHLEPAGELAVGDVLPVVLTSGLREGEQIGTVTVTGFENGEALLDVRLRGAKAPSQRCWRPPALAREPEWALQGDVLT
jgi:hypothetical protein